MQRFFAICNSCQYFSDKENSGSKAAESNDAGKDNVSFGEMHCSCIPFFVDNIVIISFLLFQKV